MGRLSVKKISFLFAGSLFALTVLIQCTKENVNANLIDRDLPSQPDTAIFGSFYDTILIDQRDVVPDVNDVITTSGVQSIVRTYCASQSCHGGNIAPKLTNYAEIKSLVIPGDPEGSKLMQVITTSDEFTAMPPINYGSDLSGTEKTVIYNWIRNGAKERPDLVDYRRTAIPLITNGCASANCHNAATVGGYWARNRFLTIATTDTVNFTYTDPGGAIRNYAQLKEPKLSEVWNAYKDSVRKFYADTVANASFRPTKTFGAPVAPALPSTTGGYRGPLNTYDDIIFDVWFPKALRTHSRVVYTNPAGKGFYVQGDYLNRSITSTSSSPASSLISRIDSTLLLAAPRTKVFNAAHQGDMAYGDGGFSKSEIALIKAWYFADPNVPDVWKYGIDGSGIFKYRKSGTIIRKQ